jgi:signal peptidase II
VVFKLLIATGFGFFLDQFSKRMVARHLAEGQAVSVASWLRIRRVTNRRGVLLSHHPRVLLLAWAVLLAGSYLIIWKGYILQSGPAQLVLGLALGGAGSNMYDQLRCGAVLDFLDLGWWPVFNLADVAVTLGATLTLWSLL